MKNGENKAESRIAMNGLKSESNPTNPDPTKTDLYGMLTDEQIREYLASARTDERLRARLLREVERRRL